MVFRPGSVPQRVPGRQCPAIFALLFLLSMSGYSAETTPTTPESEARRALAKRDLPLLESLIEQGLRASPTNAEWLLLRADLAASRGKTAEALKQVQTIVTQYPENRRARIREAQLLSHLSRPFSAAERYSAYLRESPSDLEARVGLGQTFYWRGDWADAENLFAGVLKDEPDHELAIYSYVRVLIATGRLSIAWRVAREHDRRTEEKDGELGLILAGMAARVEAFELADSLASRPTDDPDLLRRQLAFRAMQLIRLGKHEDGLKLLEPYYQPDSTDYDGLMDAANAFQSADQRVMARTLFERAIALSPERAEARMGLARIASREGRLNGSLSIYQQVVRENPEQIEAWLGVIRLAHLLNDPEVVALALDRAWKMAPKSAFLFQEDIRLAMQSGDAEIIDTSLRKYAADQPEDRAARLWTQRWRRASRLPIRNEDVIGLLDPMSPDSTAMALCLLSPAAAVSEREIALVPQASEAPLRTGAAGALAQQLVLLLQRDAAVRVATTAAPDSAIWTRTVGAAWWAFLSTPWTLVDTLTVDLDSQSVSVWLAAETQRRLRVFQSETESPLWDEWMLCRAHWFAAWRERWASQEAAADLRQSLAQLVPGWTEEIRKFQIDEAWRESEVPLPESLNLYPQLIARVRWRQHRYEYDGALSILKEIESSYPLAVEAIQRQAEIFRASGRWRDTELILQRLAAAERPSPIVRLDYAVLLRRMGRMGAAQYQLNRLSEEGFAEPEYYLQQALLAEAEGLDHAAWDWSVQGLRSDPRAPDLISFQAGWLLRHDQPERLAALIAEGGPPSWTTPDMLAEAAPFLSAERRSQILNSAQWIFTWQWLSWERLEGHSLAALEKRSRRASELGQLPEALESIQPALNAKLPESELWLRAGRLLYLDQRGPESERAYKLAGLLGGGRPDAEVAELAQLARRRPEAAARELANRLESHPNDPSLRAGLVLALLRAGKVAEADRALAPLVESDPEDPDVQMLAAQVKGAMGRVRQARSLYSSLLDSDPLSSDIAAGKIALRDNHEWGVTMGYEYDLRNSTTGGGSLDPWRQAFVSAFLRRPFIQTWTIDYNWYDRNDEQASQILFGWTRGLGPDWIVQANGGVGLGGDIVPQWRTGAGASYRLFGECFANLDFNYQDFSQVNVLQIIPGIIWQWNPRGRLAARAYVTEYWAPTGATDQGVFFAMDESWQFGPESWLIVNLGVGGKGVTNDQIVLYGDDTQQGVGISWRQGWNHRWLIQPSYRFEVHKTFNLQAFSLSVGCRF